MSEYLYKRGIQKILLIRPPLTISSYESKSLVCPLGLGYVASVLENSYEVRILDCLAEGFDNELRNDRFITYGTSLKDIKSKIEEFRPDIVGVSCLFSMQFCHALSVCQIAKEVDPGLITIMGGNHPSASPEGVLENLAVDFVVIGEAEESIIQLLEAIEKNGDFSLIDGLGYKENNNIIINPKIRFIHDLDNISFPSRHLLPMEIYFKINRPHGMDARGSPNTNIITSRGCPARCIFCSIHTVFGSGYRARTPENVLAEIELLKREYGIKEIQFEDDNLTLDKERAKRIFTGMIEKNMNIAWTTPNGVALWALDDEIIKLMKESGCWHLALGIESGDQEVLEKIIGKPLRLEKIKSLIEQMARLKIRTTSFFVLGFPGESAEQMKKTLKFAASLPTDDINFYFATPYPGTRLCRISKEQNLLKPDFNLADLKVSEVNILPRDISVSQLKRMVAKAILLFRLKRLLKRPHIFIFKWLRRFIKEPKSAILKVLRLSLRLFT
jgi:magnesium-protoporphyrin IX monomethyl ester (oxidative) cyclase